MRHIWFGLALSLPIGAGTLDAQRAPRLEFTLGWGVATDFVDKPHQVGVYQHMLGAEVRYRIATIPLGTIGARFVHDWAGYNEVYGPPEQPLFFDEAGHRSLLVGPEVNVALRPWLRASASGLGGRYWRGDQRGEPGAHAQARLDFGVHARFINSRIPGLGVGARFWTAWMRDADRERIGCPYAGPCPQPALRNVTIRGWGLELSYAPGAARGR